MRGRFIKLGLIMAVMMASLLVFVMPASAATSVDYIAPLNTTTVFAFEHTGNLNINEPCATNTGLTGDSSYHAQPFYVDADGAYTVHINVNHEADTVAFLYLGAFNPADFSQNCQIFTDDGGSVGNEEINANLTANTQYYLVTSLCCGNNYFTRTGTFDIDNRILGVGNITLGTIPTPATPASSIIPSDGRLNPQLGDIDAVIYPGRDFKGDVSMQIYCVNQLTAEGFIAMVITPDDLPANPVSENTLLMTSEICEGRVEFYALAAGGQYAYQVNAGPSVEGTVHEYLFNSLSGADLIMRTFNLYELGN